MGEVSNGIKFNKITLYHLFVWVYNHFRVVLWASWASAQGRQRCEAWWDSGCLQKKIVDRLMSNLILQRLHSTASPGAFSISSPGAAANQVPSRQ